MSIDPVAGRRRTGAAFLDSAPVSCYVFVPMNIAAVLPHVEVFGGVRRYIELGNEFVRRGHRYVILTPQGKSPDWLAFRGEVGTFADLTGGKFDIGLCSEYSVLREFDRLEASLKYFYFVLRGHKLEKEVIRRGYEFLGNSEGICRYIERKYRVACIKAAGGVNPDIFHPLGEPGRRREDTPDFRILCYGRIYKRRKGVQYVIKAAERLWREFPNLRLVFFDSLVGADRRDPRLLVRTSVPYEFHIGLPQSDMARLFSRADVFVGAERRAGWANTAAEAMACGVPVVCTRSGTRDFAVHGETALVVPLPLPWLIRRQIRRLMLDQGLRRQLSRAGYEAISRYSWSALAGRLERLFLERSKLK